MFQVQMALEMVQERIKCFYAKRFLYNVLMRNISFLFFDPKNLLFTVLQKSQLIIEFNIFGNS